MKAAQAVEELRALLGELELAVHAEYISTHFRHIPPSVPGAWVTPGVHLIPHISVCTQICKVPALVGELSIRRIV